MAERDPRLEGYSEWKGIDKFEDYTGPYYFKRDENGEFRCAFIVEDKHINGQSSVHGGALMTFADYSLFVLAQDVLKDRHSVTVSFSCDFTAGAEVGEFVEATGEVVHETRSLVFMRGTVFSEKSVLLRFSALLKKTRVREPREV